MCPVGVGLELASETMRIWLEFEENAGRQNEPSPIGEQDEASASIQRGGPCLCTVGKLRPGGTV